MWFIWTHDNSLSIGYNARIGDDSNYGTKKYIMDNERLLYISYQTILHGSYGSK